MQSFAKRMDKPKASTWEWPSTVMAGLITDNWFDGGHPNPDHPTGVTIEPDTRRVWFTTATGKQMYAVTGEYVIASPGTDRYTAMCADDFEAVYEPVTDVNPVTIGHDSDLEGRFTYHTPKEGQPEKYEHIRFEAKTLAYLMRRECPESRELSLALTKLEEVVMWANAAIARHG